VFVSEVSNMPRNFLLILTAISALAANDPWAKVRELKSGSEVRVYKAGSSQPITGKLDEVHDDSIVLILKNEQVGVQKDEIDRLDARPSQAGNHMIKDTHTRVDNPDPAKPTPGPSQGATGPTTSTTTNLNLRPKADFDTVYRRTAAAAEKPESHI
jgi:hypothetical protein